MAAGGLVRDNGSLRGGARGPHGEVELALQAVDTLGVPGLDGVTVDTAGGLSISLDRGPGGLAASRRSPDGRTSELDRPRRIAWRERHPRRGRPSGPLARPDLSPGAHSRPDAAALTEAVIFDLDGVLIDSEQIWDDARREFVIEQGGRWRDSAQRDMMGMSSVEWSHYLAEQLGVDLPAERISEEVADRLAALYRERLPLLPGAREAVERLAQRWPLAVASSSNRGLIDLVLELAGIAACFRATVSSEEVPRGKPAPDVYLAAAGALGVAPDRCAAIEDSRNGIASAAAAGMRVIAVPNPHFPPDREALAAAAHVVGSLDELTVEAVDG